MSQTTTKDLVLFAQMNANFPAFTDWLRAERESAVKHMSLALGDAQMRQAQGKVQLLDSMIDTLVSAHKLIH